MSERMDSKISSNPLHHAIGDMLGSMLTDQKDIALLKDPACGGNQRIPLFCSKKRSRETEYCNVDLAIIKNNKVRVILEIEESNVKPTQVCGKFLTSALSHYYTHGSSNGKPLKLGSKAAFIQILDNSKLKLDSRKVKQWTTLERSIQSMLPIKGSSITRYKLMHTSINEANDKKSKFNKQLTSMIKALTRIS
jgi:hypothetical protein